MIRRTLLVSSFALLALAPAASAHGPKVIASGLDNPRGIDVAPSGAVYVAEAGRGGDGPCITGPEGGEVCVGLSGAITKVAFGHQRRVVRGLPSTAGEDGSAATGPQDVDVTLFGYGSLVTGLAGTPDDRATLGEQGAGLGRLYDFTPFGRAHPRADLAGYEGTADPDKDVAGSEGIDSNPTGVLNQRHGSVAVDAGGNDLLRVGFGGSISTLAVLTASSSTRRRSWGPARHQDPEPGRPDRGRQGPRWRLLRLPVYRLPVPTRQGEHLPRRPRLRADDLRVGPDQRHRPRLRPQRQPLRRGYLKGGPAQRAAGGRQRGRRDPDPAQRETARRRRRPALALRRRGRPPRGRLRDHPQRHGRHGRGGARPLSARGSVRRRT